MHGFGTLNYHKDATNAWNECGLYEHDFLIPKSWAGRRVFLVFDGVMTDTSAKLNGQSVGPTHQGGFYRFKYEVTRLVRFGETNRLDVRVAKHSANESVNRAERLADYWVFGGIYRPVYLEAVPQEFIKRVAINATADGGFTMDVHLRGEIHFGEVEAQIQTVDGQKVGSLLQTAVPPGVPAEVVKLKTQVNSPELWSAETPNLYQVVVRLKENGMVVHQITQRFGFRTFEVRDGDGLYLNGQRVVLKGCDRHSFWPDSGRCLSDAVQLLDIKTMKAMNMNAVRMSHYPPDADFLDRCDELGLYVLDELAGWHHYYDTDIGTNLVREMVTRDVNHPSILFWDNGNEGGFNTNLDKIFGEYDVQQRRVLHPWAPFSGVNTAHYLPWAFARSACQGFPIIFHKNHYEADTHPAQKFIYMPTEFMHGLFDGGAGAGLADMWSLMEKSPYLGGGFIWALLDEGVKRPDGKIDVAGNQAPDGIVGPYRQREASFYAIKQIWSPLQILETNLPARFNGTLTLKNRYSFINARECHFDWQLIRFDTPAAGKSEHIVAHGEAEAPDISPGQNGRLQLNLPANWQALVAREKIGALALKISGPRGHELWQYVWPLPAILHSPILEAGGNVPAFVSKVSPVIVNDGSRLQVYAGDLTVSFDKKSGYLAGIKSGGQTFSLANGPRPAVGAARLIRLQADCSNDCAMVTATYAGTLRQVTWRVGAGNRVQCDYTYEATGTNAYFGVLFDYPEKMVRAKSWLGDGPYRVWKNRREGVELGFWRNDYNNTITGWRDWVYPEFKGCFAKVYWLQLETSEGRITVEPRQVPFVQVLTPEFPPLKTGGHTIPAVPACGLGFLDAIPPIGSKFQPAEAVSPSGEFSAGHGRYDGSLVFHFGRKSQAD
jgi:hypothetical protein